MAQNMKKEETRGHHHTAKTHKAIYMAPSLYLCLHDRICLSIIGHNILTVFLHRMHLMTELELTMERKNGFLSES